MYNNTAKVRTRLKIDTEAHWNLARNFIPLAGEPIIYAADDIHERPRVKVGDGTTYVVDLPFITAESENNAYIKTGTTAEWNNQPQFVPDNGMIIVYTDKGQTTKDGQIINIPKIKIGDGNAYCVDLPFIDDDIFNIINNHINNSTIHVSQAEKIFWNNKINSLDEVEEENLIFTRL